MKKVIYIIFIFSVALNAQEFKIDKISGAVKMLRGTSENWEDVYKSLTLNDSDLIVTEENSFIKISNNETQFLLKSNSAIDISKVKNMSMDDLLLALAMENIRAIPKSKSNGKAKNTAVYGEKSQTTNSIESSNDYLGEKLLNGAKQLAEIGYKKSAVVAAKETYRKHPSTLSNFDDRIYFADILIELNLFNEAQEELQSLSKLDLSDKKKNVLAQKLDQIKSSLLAE